MNVNRKSPLLRLVVAVLGIVLLTVGFRPAATLAQEITGNFNLSTFGAAHVYTGHDLYIGFSGVRTSGTTSHVYVSTLNLPPGVTTSYPDLERTCCGDGRGGYFMWSVQQSFTTAIKLRVPSASTPGTYTITLAVENNGLSQSIPFTFTVLAIPPAVERRPYINFQEAPGLTQYHDQMIAYGMSELCDQEKIRSLGLWEGNAWYYDGTRVAYQISDYTQTDFFNGCARYPLDIYRPYVLNNSGSVPGWRVFPQGLRMDYERTGDEASKQAAISLTNAAYGANGIVTAALIPESMSRETAYAIAAMLEAEKLGAPRHPRLAEYVDLALGQLDQWFVIGRYGRVAPFMFGLTSEALIKYHDATQDPRILPALKSGADWIWAHAWVSADRSFCYEYTSSAAGNGCSAGAPDLNLLVVPVYGWLYAQTGDPRYIEIGDQIFLGGVQGAWLAQGKQFSQNYRWSMEYLKWRKQQVAPTPTPTSTPATPPPTLTPHPTKIPAAPTAIPTDLDTQAPSAPTRFSCSKVDLGIRRELLRCTWHASSEKTGVTLYQIFRNGALFATTNKTVYRRNFVNGTFGVRAQDSAGNLSEMSNATTCATQTKRSQQFQGKTTEKKNRQQLRCRRL